MNPEPTTRLVDQAIQAARYGKLREDLVSSASSLARINERTLRNGFAALRSSAQRQDVSAEAHGLLRDLNGLYRTRYSIEKIVSLSPLVYSAISDMDWWRHSPVRVSDASDSTLLDNAAAVSAILRTSAQSGLDRPYSLMTKFLHFCFPDSFGIYDAQAASSIQTWAYFSFPLSNDQWKQFAWGAMTNPDASGYSAILEFYSLCWTCAGDERLAALKLAAQALSDEIDAPVSPLYVIDNLLWRASGDPRALGLL